MTFYPRAARHLILLTAIACASNNSSTSFVAAAATTEPTGSNGWRNDLNWEELETKLSPSAALVNTSFKDYRDQCIPEFYETPSSNHALHNQPSGLCLHQLFNGWEVGSWMAEWISRNGTPAFGGTLQLKPLDTVMGFEGDDTTPSPIMGDESKRSLNIPSMVVFPANASDVIHIIQFAKKHNIELSVKNSGHSYSGASTKKNTLLINMSRFVHYAAGGITDCDQALLGIAVADDLSNQACLLALARGKPGLIRVGGGENYDKVYGAVIAANKAQDAYKYHVVGGAAATVSPMGWTFQGGNAGTMGGRMYGKGVDQVLHVEMVAPNGHHIKFGPTEWEDASAEGFVVPRTTVVSGVCRSNPDEQDEEKWMWGDCPEYFDVDFMDLWFAVRGGGGGTWGVVTSVTLQLQEYLPYKLFHFGGIFSPYDSNFMDQFPPQEECGAALPEFRRFAARYFMAPSLLNVTKERSLACSAPFMQGTLYCYGEEDVMKAWTNFLEMRNSTDYVSCLVQTVDTSSGESPMSYPEAHLLFGENARFPGKVPDDPLQIALPPANALVLIPQSWIDESEENIDTLLEYTNIIVGNEYYAYGVATYSFSDQANSLPQTAREAAVMKDIGSLLGRFKDSFWSDLFPKMYDISDKTKFPAVFQSNHAGPSAHGPLKDDWTKACPQEWTVEERKEKCISAQEAIYGTELLRRLETIKMKVDPDFIFNCHNCIGNNLDVVKAPEVPPDEPSSVAVDEPSGASFASTYAAAISATATVLYLFLSLF